MRIKTLIILLVVSILLCLITTVGIYIFNFKTNNISKNPQDWALFADYFGGILNPLLGILNLIILTYLTLQIVKVEDSRNNWTLQELARPYAIIHFDSIFKDFEIRLNNCGLGPMIISNISIERMDGTKFSNFVDVIKEINIKTELNPSVITFHSGPNHSAIPKDGSIHLLKMTNNENDKMVDFREFIKITKKRLNEYSIRINYEDMYGRKMPEFNENINYPDL